MSHARDLMASLLLSSQAAQSDSASLSATVVSKPPPIISVQTFNSQLTIGSKDEALRKAADVFKSAAESMERGRIKGEKYWVDALKIRRGNWGLIPAPLPYGAPTGKGADKTSKDFLISYGLEECAFLDPLFQEERNRPDLISSCHVPPKSCWAHAYIWYHFWSSGLSTAPKRPIASLGNKYRCDWRTSLFSQHIQQNRWQYARWSSQSGPTRSCGTRNIFTTRSRGWKLTDCIRPSCWKAHRHRRRSRNGIEIWIGQPHPLNNIHSANIFLARYRRHSFTASQIGGRQWKVWPHLLQPTCSSITQALAYEATTAWKHWDHSPSRPSWNRTCSSNPATNYRPDTVPGFLWKDKIWNWQDGRGSVYGWDPGEFAVWPSWGNWPRLSPIFWRGRLQCCWWRSCTENRQPVHFLGLSIIIILTTVSQSHGTVDFSIAIFVDGTFISSHPYDLIDTATLSAADWRDRKVPLAKNMWPWNKFVWTCWWYLVCGS